MRNYPRQHEMPQTAKVAPLAYLEVTPRVAPNNNNNNHHCWTAIGIKEQLLRHKHFLIVSEKSHKTVASKKKKKKNRSKIRQGWLTTPHPTEEPQKHAQHAQQPPPPNVAPALLLHSACPTDTELTPCHCRGFVILRATPQLDTHHDDVFPVRIHSGTLVVVGHHHSIGAKVVDPGGDNFRPWMPPDDLIVQNHTTATTELLHRFRLLLRQPLWIGTTRDAIQKRQAWRQYRSDNYNLSIRASNHTLLIHSPHATDDKISVLIQALLVVVDRVYILRPGPFLATFSTSADAALMATIHGLLMAAAVRDESVVFVWEQGQDYYFDSTHNVVDPALQVVYRGIQAYWRQWTTGVTAVPFPMSVPLYNLGQDGYSLPVRAGMILCMTCPDDVVATQWGPDRYRFPDLSAATRVQMMQELLRDIPQTRELTRNLPRLAAAAVDVRGWNGFQRIAQLLGEQGTDVAVGMFQKAVQCAFPEITGSIVSFQSNEEDEYFGTVGGNNEAKMVLEDALALDPVKRKLMQKLQIAPPTGILLYGPPGTGKTLLARAVANVMRARNNSSGMGAAFVSLRSTDVAQAQVGTGERMVKEAFRVARQNTPSVVFIDEFQALFTERSSGGSNRLSSTLMLCMDSLSKWREMDAAVGSEEEEGAQSNQIVVLAATNTPWMVDASFLRPGRFDRTVHVGLPTESEREEIFMMHLKRMKMDLNDNLDLLAKQLAKHTDRFSGADIALCVQTAAVKCLLSGNETVEASQLNQVLTNRQVVPSSSESLVDKISQWT